MLRNLEYFAVHWEYLNLIEYNRRHLSLLFLINSFFCVNIIMITAMTVKRCRRIAINYQLIRRVIIILQNMYINIGKLSRE